LPAALLIISCWLLVTGGWLVAGYRKEFTGSWLAAKTKYDELKEPEI